MSRFRGLTWDHPRGYNSLAEAASSVPDLIQWGRQPLEGFESRPIEEICAEYDVVVLDHPHLGDALGAACLQPLDKLIASEKLAAIRDRTIGPCFDSYVMDGHTWALPLDAAAQVSAGRLDLMNAPMPDSWTDVQHFAKGDAGFVLSLAGPHAFLSLLSMCATFDERFGTIAQGLLEPHHDAAVALFLDLLFRSHPIGSIHNPIGILTAMAAGEGPTYCPLIFGYVPFAEESAVEPVVFRNAPSVGGARHAVLGGTGLAVTARCVPDRELLDHLVWLMSADVQADFLPRHSGQPSAEASWASPALNGGNNGFYAHTLATLRHAFVRPRVPAIVPAQNRAASWLRDLRGGPAPSASVVRDQVNRILAKETADFGA
ncbi:carbohydrate ABC transporter substrate-binding protein [Sphingomonas sp. 1P08PE]|uniref:carbohydrate ABC transporter substrate-binding protein n=1 Tax=Sphingomonas sp. 1P08PE TaxID=554122 RepID=UPI0039A1501F